MCEKCDLDSNEFEEKITNWVESKMKEKASKGEPVNASYQKEELAEAMAYSWNEKFDCCPTVIVSAADSEYYDSVSYYVNHKMSRAHSTPASLIESIVYSVVRDALLTKIKQKSNTLR